MTAPRRSRSIARSASRHASASCARRSPSSRAVASPTASADPASRALPTARGRRRARQCRMTIRIGISGWRYEPWRGIFYPADLAQRLELHFAARAFSSIEINGSFYSLQSPASWECWREETPDDFVFSVKGPRYVTHILRLRNVLRPLANFFASGVLALGAKLGPILWQFPPSLKYDRALFGAFLDLLP